MAGHIQDVGSVKIACIQMEPYIGDVVGYDGWFPEVYRLCALQGADLICVPTNWVPMPGQPAGQEPMAVTLAMASAHSNSMFIACADRVGSERGQAFIGKSLIVD